MVALTTSSLLYCGLYNGSEPNESVVCLLVGWYLNFKSLTLPSLSDLDFFFSVFPCYGNKEMINPLKFPLMFTWQYFRL